MQCRRQLLGMLASATATLAPRRLPRAKLGVMRDNVASLSPCPPPVKLPPWIFLPCKQSLRNQCRRRPIHRRRHLFLQFHPPKVPPATPQRPKLLHFPAPRRQAPVCRYFHPPAAVIQSPRRHNSWSGNSWISAGDGQHSQCLFQ
nr:hypothetical protein SEVIR_9G277633v2 [Setaria viridis]